MKNKSSFLSSAVAPVALLVILIATIVPFFFMKVQWAQAVYPYVYSVGAIILLIARLFSPYRGTDMRLKRLHRIESWSAIFFCVAAFFLFYPGAQLRDWIAFTLAGAAIQVFTSIAIPNQESKAVK